MKKTPAAKDTPPFAKGEKVIISGDRKCPQNGKIGRVVKAEWYDMIVVVDGEAVPFRAYQLSKLPVKGMGGTTGFNGDYYPYTIHKVSDDYKKIWASADEYKVVGGPYPTGTQYFPCEFSNKNAKHPENWTCYTLRKNGRYVAEGQGLESVWGTLGIGHRTYAQNPSF